MKGVEFSLDAVIRNTRTIKNQTGNEINGWLWRVIKTHEHGLFDAWVKSWWAKNDSGLAREFYRVLVNIIFISL